MSNEDQTRVNTVGDVKKGTELNGIYRIDEKIAVGGMGEVYRGHNIQTNDPVAIKIVLPEFARDETILALFRKEASVLNHLSHDAIVRYHVLSIDAGIARPYLAMEFVDGELLADRAARAPFTLAETITLTRHLASGLQTAHNAGVIHRDLSPDNIIISQGQVGRAKIIDFGIAKSAQVGGGTLLGGKFAGKYNFVSPEQLGLFGGEVTPKSDIYSLGLVVAAAMRGAPIDMSGTQVDIIEKRRHVPDLSEVDQALLPLITAMLQPDPNNRPASMAEITQWLSAMKADGARTASAGPDTSDAIRTVVTDPPAPREKAAEPHAPAVSQAPISQAPVSQAPMSQAPASQAPASHAPAALATPESPPSPPHGETGVDGPTGAAPAPAGGAIATPADFGPAALEPEPAGRPLPEDLQPAASPPPPSSPQPATSLPESAARAPQPSRPHARAKPEPEKKAGRFAMVAALLVVLIAAAGGGAYYFFLLDEPVTQVATTDDQPKLVPSAPPLAPADDEADPAPGGSTPGDSAPGGQSPGTPDLAGQPPVRTDPAAGAEKPEQKDSPEVVVSKAATMMETVDEFKGGRCFYASAMDVGDRKLSIEGFGLTPKPFEKLEQLVISTFGVEPDIGMRQIVDSQCAVVEFLAGIRSHEKIKPVLDLSNDWIKSGDSLRGSVSNIGDKVVSIFLIDNEGVVYNLGPHLKRGDGRADFNIKLVELAPRNPLPQLILTVATSQNVEKLRESNPVLAKTYFPSLLKDMKDSGGDYGTALKFFKLGG